MICPHSTTAHATFSSIVIKYLATIGCALTSSSGMNRESCLTQYFGKLLLDF